LIGVIIIAHPRSIFGPTDDVIKTSDEEISPAQRLFAITISVLGIFGASGAYTTIRIIGNRAHALVSVSYFAALGTVGSAVALVIIPGISFTMPDGPREWILLLTLGIFGFGLQFLLTAGLQLDRSSKATSMMYTQVLFALSFDWAIWGVLPGGWSLVGGSIVIASTLWSALQKTQKSVEEVKVKEVDEESALLGDERDSAAEVVRRGSISA
jgi:drug/metabolite transporter (DMT)-like permease